MSGLFFSRCSRIIRRALHAASAFYFWWRPDTFWTFALEAPELFWFALLTQVDKAWRETCRRQRASLRPAEKVGIHDTIGGVEEGAVPNSGNGCGGGTHRVDGHGVRLKTPRREGSLVSFSNCERRGVRHRGRVLQKIASEEIVANDSSASRARVAPRVVFQWRPSGTGAALERRRTCRGTLPS